MLHLKFVYPGPCFRLCKSVNYGYVYIFFFDYSRLVSFILSGLLSFFGPIIFLRSEDGTL